MSAAPVFVIDGGRTPFLLARGQAGPFSAVDLAVWAGRPLLLRQPFGPEALDEVLLGCMHPSVDEPNPGRLAAVRLGAITTPGGTLQRNGGSGLQAVVDGYRAIASGHAQLVLVGGAEAQSRLRLAPGADPLCGLAMGQAADALGYRFGIRRAAADGYALESHRRLARAREHGRPEQIEPLFDAAGACYLHDDGAQVAVTGEQLATLEPLFDKPYGNVTAGNSAPAGDGAAWLLLASEAACGRWSLTPKGRLVDGQWAALAPELTGLGPAFAVAPLLRRQGLAARDIDAWELEEAFAAEVLACLVAWASDDFCRSHLGLEAALGPVDPGRLNVEGGAIALGRPPAASGARLVLQLLEVLRSRSGRWGVAALAIGGGQGGALLMEAL